LPVVPITSACNLECPICYTINKNDGAHFTSIDDMSRILAHLAEYHEQHDVATTILPAVAAGVNDDEVGTLLDLVLRKPHIRSLELHTLTFTGQGGVGFQRTARITIPDLHRRIEAATGGRIGWRDFVPSPLAHP